MDFSEICPTCFRKIEWFPTVQAIGSFLYHLVSPLLREDDSNNHNLPPSQHEKMAKQRVMLFFYQSTFKTDTERPGFLIQDID
ncbi:hypothetical protein MTR_4g046083 [Medicago truncatula]|uniref:Uncharacterized protein n=1 Tax=Medicago truncatula TaxID=3880 RepID=A0A072UKJ6_MEDTR|nr:hypothetical protein MTR_4g046083 [Medicago truncatula]